MTLKWKYNLIAKEGHRSVNNKNGGGGGSNKTTMWLIVQFLCKMRNEKKTVSML